MRQAGAKLSCHAKSGPSREKLTECSVRSLVRLWDITALLMI